jgi:hypothetical protein
MVLCCPQPPIALIHLSPITSFARHGRETCESSAHRKHTFRGFEQIVSSLCTTQRNREARILKIRTIYFVSLHSTGPETTRTETNSHMYLYLSRREGRAGVTASSILHHMRRGVTHFKAECYPLCIHTSTGASGVLLGWLCTVCRTMTFLLEF